MKDAAPVLVAGATGLLGSALAPALVGAGHEVVRHGCMKVADLSADLSDAQAAKGALERLRPSAIVNLAALTDVDRCEQDPRAAFRVNVRVAENLAAWMRSHPGTRFVQISTDQVYDGPGPHAEGDVSPVNIYAWSKYCAEQVACSAGATVLRTNFFGRVRGARASFSDWILAHARRGAWVPLVTDVLFNPLHVATLCRLLLRVIASPVPGLFNLGSHGGMSKRDFGLAMAAELGFDAALVRPVAVADLGLRARRPRDMRMDVSHFESAFGVSLPELKDEIALLKDEHEDT